MKPCRLPGLFLRPRNACPAYPHGSWPYAEPDTSSKTADTRLRFFTTLCAPGIESCFFSVKVLRKMLVTGSHVKYSFFLQWADVKTFYVQSGLKNRNAFRCYSASTVHVTTIIHYLHLMTWGRAILIFFYTDTSWFRVRFCYFFYIVHNCLCIMILLFCWNY